MGTDKLVDLRTGLIQVGKLRAVEQVDDQAFADARLLFRQVIKEVLR